MTVVGEAYINIKATDSVSAGLAGVSGKIEETVGGAGEKGSARFKAAMGTIGKSIAGAMGPAFGPIGEVVEKLEGIGEAAEHMHGRVGKAFVGVGAAALGAGTLLTTMGDKDKIAMGQLQTSVENAGGSWEEYKEETEKTIKSQEKYGHSAVETQDSLNNLITKTGDVKGSYENLGIATNLAAQKHITLQAASNIVAKVMNGNVKVLKQYGISADAIGKASDTAAQKEKKNTLVKLQNTQATEKAAIEALKEKDAKLKASIAVGADSTARAKLLAAMRNEHIASLQSQLAATKDKGERAKLTAEINKEKAARTASKDATLTEAEAKAKVKDVLIADAAQRAKLTDALKANKDKQKELTTEIKNGVSPLEKGAAGLQLLANKLKGQADVAANTFTGRMKEARAKVEDFIGTVGQKVGPVLQTVGPALLGIGAILETGVAGKLKSAGGKVLDFVKGMKAWGIVTKIQTGLQAALNLVMDANPIALLVIGIAALVGGFILAYNKIKPFHDLINTIAKAIGGFFVASFNIAKGVLSSFAAHWSDIWDNIKKVLNIAWGVIKGIFKLYFAIPIAIITHWSTIVGFFKGLWSTIVRDVSGFFNSVVGFFTRLWTTIKTTVSHIISDVVSFFAGLPGRIVSALSSLGRTVSGAISRAFSGIKGLVTGIFSAAGSWLASAGNSIIHGLVNGITAVWGTISSTIGRIGGIVKNAIGNAVSWLASAGNSVITGFVNGIKAFLGNIGGALSGIGTTVKNALSDAGSWLYDIGGQIIGGLIDGIKNAISGIGNVVGGIGQFIKDHKGPPSYDRIMLTPQGGMIIDGLIQGIESKIPALGNSLKGISDKISMPFSTTVNANGSGGKVSTTTTDTTPHAGQSRVINLFPGSNINFAGQSPAAIVQRLQNAVVASRI